MKTLQILILTAIISFPLCAQSLESTSVSIDESNIALLKSPQTLKSLATGGRLPILDGKKTKLWLSTIVKGSPLKPHRHTVGRWILPLEDSVIYKHYNSKSGKAVAKMEWKRGEIYFYPADEEGVYHNDENHSDIPVQVLVFVLHEDGLKKVAEEMPADFDVMDSAPIENAQLDAASSVMPKPSELERKIENR